MAEEAVKPTLVLTGGFATDVTGKVINEVVFPDYKEVANTRVLPNQEFLRHLQTGKWTDEDLVIVVMHPRHFAADRSLMEELHKVRPGKPLIVVMQDIAGDPTKYRDATRLNVVYHDRPPVAFVHDAMCSRDQNLLAQFAALIDAEHEKRQHPTDDAITFQVRAEYKERVVALYARDLIKRTATLDLCAETSANVIDSSVGSGFVFALCDAIETFERPEEGVDFGQQHPGPT